MQRIPGARAPARRARRGDRHAVLHRQDVSSEHRNQIIAEHGSWNRAVLQGYRLSLVKLDGNKVVSYTRFAEGWLRGMKPAAAGGAMIGDVWGRPADVLVMPDGALLVSDDKAGVVYRISYSR